MSSENVSSLVPEIYYDLIARICSGTPFVLAVIWMYGWYASHLRGIDSSLSILLVVGMGYIAGHLLTTISAIWNFLIWRGWFVSGLCSLLNLYSPFPSESLARGFLNVYKRIDLIAEYDKTGGSILKKMEAGAAMTDNLFSGYLVLLGLAISSKGWRAIPLGPAALILILLLGSVILRRALLISRQDALLSNLKPGVRENTTDATCTQQKGDS